MKEQDLLEEIGKVSEELIAAHALPDAKRSGEGGADKSSTAKEHIVMSEKRSEYIKNPIIRALPAIAAAAAVIAAGFIILPKTNLMKTPGASVISDAPAETGALAGFSLNVREAALKVVPNAELEHSASLETEAELTYNGEATPPTVWYSGFKLEKNDKVLYENLADSVQPEHFENPQADSEQDIHVTIDQEPEPIPVAFSAQGAIPFTILARELDPHFIQNEVGDLMLTAYFRVDSPTAEPVTLTVPVSYQVVEITGVEMPDITGWTYNEARETLMEYGLMIDKRSSYDDEVPEGIVISSDPQGPATVSPGDYIRITVSLGPNKNTVLVPAFTWMNWDMAQETAAGMGLVLEKKEVGSNEEPGTVLSQSIQLGEEVAEGTVIELEVAKQGDSDDAEQEFRFEFPIPEVSTRSFHIEFFADGALIEKGHSFAPATLSSPITMAVRVSKSMDLNAVLVDEETGKQADIGTYHIDYDHGTYELTSGTGELNTPIQRLTK